MKNIKALLVNVMTMLMWNVRTARADEGAPAGEGTPAPEGTPATAPTVNFEELISKARKEEKEKLYPEINKLKAQVEEKVKRINELLIALGEKDEIIKGKDSEIAGLKKNSKATESDEIKALKVKIAKLENALSDKESEIASIKLEAYKTAKIAEAGGELIPELVTGRTPEEIDLAIEKSKARYAEIVGRVKNTVVVNQKPSTEIPPANPNTQAFYNQINTMDIAGLSMFDKNSRSQYSEMRKQLGLK